MVPKCEQIVVKLVLKPPFPTRDAAGTLRRQVLEHLLASKPPVGTRLGTDAELVEQTRLSRSTIRRALDLLQKEGWIDRRAGAGTFVGPRIASVEGDADHPLRAAYGRAFVAPHHGPREGSTDDLPGFAAPRPRRERHEVLRLAVLVFKIGDLAHDWYTPRVLEGVNQAAEEHNVSVEILGNSDFDVDAIARRLAQSRPDVLACLTNDPRQAMVIRDAQRMGITTMVTGTPLMNLGVPVVLEDNRQAMKLAVDHLHQLGHERIGLICQRAVERWVFDRHEAFTDLTAPGDSARQADGFTHWLPLSPPAADAPMLDTVEHFIRANRLTAVIPASGLAMHCLDSLVRSNRLRVPDDVSVVSFEQDWQQRRWLGMASLATVAFPLEDMGRTIARFARAALEARPIPAMTVLPCNLIRGPSAISLNVGGSSTVANPVGHVDSSVGSGETAAGKQENDRQSRSGDD